MAVAGSSPAVCPKAYFKDKENVFLIRREAIPGNEKDVAFCIFVLDFGSKLRMWGCCVQICEFGKVQNLHHMGLCRPYCAWLDSNGKWKLVNTLRFLQKYHRVWQ